MQARPRPVVVVVVAAATAAAACSSRPSPAREAGPAPAPGSATPADDAGAAAGAAAPAAAAPPRAAFDPAATPSQPTAAAADVTVGWDGDALVAARAGTDGWRAVLLEDRFRLHLVTVHVAGDLVVVPLHHAAAAGSQVVALDLATGAERWRVAVTGVGPVAHSGYANRISTFVDGDAVVVQGHESAGTSICEVALADGRERACVTGVPAIALPDIAWAQRPEPPRRRVGPVTTSISCRKERRPRASLTLTRTDPGEIEGVLVSGSATCKPTLHGGIGGPRIILHVWEQGDGEARCECTIGFLQERRPESESIEIELPVGGLRAVRLPPP